MKKRLLLGILTLVASFCYAQSEYKVTAKSLNVRSEASTNAPKLGVLTNGQTVLVFSVDGDWAIIDYKDQFGYVSKQYIEPIHPVVESSNIPSMDTEFANAVAPNEFTEFAVNSEVPSDITELASLQADTLQVKKNTSMWGFLGLGMGYTYVFQRDMKKDKKLDADYHGFHIGMESPCIFGYYLGFYMALGYEFWEYKKDDFKQQGHYGYMDLHAACGGNIPNTDMSIYVHGGFGFMGGGHVAYYKENGDWKKDEDQTKYLNDKGICNVDVPLGIGAIFQYRKLALSFNFNFGMINVFFHHDDDGTIKNRDLRISLLYCIE